MYILLPGMYLLHSIIGSMKDMPVTTPNEAPKTATNPTVRLAITDEGWDEAACEYNQCSSKFNSQQCPERADTLGDVYARSHTNAYTRHHDRKHHSCILKFQAGLGYFVETGEVDVDDAPLV